jgi:mRNA interferase MazF
VETSLAAKPKRGEIWLVNLDPTIGAEIKKTRPAVIISSDSVGILPVRLIAPITGWDDRYSGNIWHIHIISDATNNLSKPSAVDVLQVRGVDTARFVHRIGKLGHKTMKEITEALAAVIEG